ncbi:MAG: hypothetical protein ACF8XB_13575 [Planctomycetota bacterium JB042]
MSQDDVLGFDDPRSMLEDFENEHDQPFVLYLTGDDKDARRRQNLMNGAFLDERVGIAAQVICMIKAPGDAIDESHPFFRHVGGDELPRVVVFARDGRKVGRLEGSATGSEVYDLMAEAFDASYEGDLDDLMRDYRKLLTKMETLRAKKRLLDDKYLTAETRSEEKKLERQLARLEKQGDKLRDLKKRILGVKRREEAAR